MVLLRRFAARERVVFAAYKLAGGDRRRGGHAQEPTCARPGEERARVRSRLVRLRVGAPDSPAAPDHEEGVNEVVHRGESEEALREIARLGLGVNKGMMKGPGSFGAPALLVGAG